MWIIASLKDSNDFVFENLDQLFHFSEELQIPHGSLKIYS